MISGLFFFNYKGELLVSRIYRGNDVGKSAADAFRVNVIHARREVRSPILTVGRTTFFHIYVNNVWVVAITRNNPNVVSVFEFLYKTVEVFKEYFGKFSEGTIKTNFVSMYEVLDEILDNGYPQRTDAEILKFCITNEGFIKPSKREDPAQITSHVTGAPTWRKDGIRYKKNEMFIDVVENVNMLMSVQGKELNSSVTGTILLKCFLSGMPECKFGLNDKISLERRKAQRKQVKPSPGNGVEIDDIQFHPCVRLNAQTKGISFVPPDGEFELMKYRTTNGIKSPFKVIPIVRELSRTKLEAKIVIKSTFTEALVAWNVELRLPIPSNCSGVKVITTKGKAKYQTRDNVLVWKIKKFSGARSVELSAEISLMATTNLKMTTTKAPISMKFQVPMFTASGLQVRFLKALEPKMNYESINRVRYMTKAGQYEVRV